MGERIEGQASRAYTKMLASSSAGSLRTGTLLLWAAFASDRVRWRSERVAKLREISSSRASFDKVMLSLASS